MLASWNLETTSGGVKISYRNLYTGQLFLVGEDEVGNGLTAFMAAEGGGGTELIFTDGVFSGYILPPLHQDVVITDTEVPLEEIRAGHEQKYGIYG